jgi:hypothetical protein
MEKDYLGDGVYAHHEFDCLWLTTLEGHRIALDSLTWAAVKRFAVRCGMEPATSVAPCPDCGSTLRNPDGSCINDRERTGEDALRDAAETDRVYQAQQDAWERAGDPDDYPAGCECNDCSGFCPGCGELPCMC